MAHRDKAVKLLYQREWYRRNRERVLQRRKEYAAAFPERIRNSRKRQKELYHERNRVKRLAKTYGISPDEVHKLDSIVACEICGVGGKLDTDHDHTTSVVRGRLCGNCNNGLGRFKVDPQLLRNAAHYLESV